MAQIPVLLAASRTPRVGEKVLTRSERVATITRIENGLAYADPLSGPAETLPIAMLRWFSPLDLWAVTKEQQ